MAVYKTSQKTELLEFLKSRSGEHVSVNDMIAYFTEKEIKIGMTTIYRHLNQMVAEGTVKKYYIDESSGSCFEYVEQNCKKYQAHHFHLKCEKCDCLIHFSCQEIETLETHIKQEHGFEIDPVRTVFYGLCEKCAKEISADENEPEK